MIFLENIKPTVMPNQRAAIFAASNILGESPPLMCAITQKGNAKIKKAIKHINFNFINTYYQT